MKHHRTARRSSHVVYSGEQHAHLLTWPQKRNWYHCFTLSKPTTQYTVRRASGFTFRKFVFSCCNICSEKQYSTPSVLFDDILRCLGYLAAVQRRQPWRECNSSHSLLDTLAPLHWTMTSNDSRFCKGGGVLFKWCSLSKLTRYRMTSHQPLTTLKQWHR